MVKIIDNSKEIEVFYVKLFYVNEEEELEFIVFFCIDLLEFKVRFVNNNRDLEFVFVEYGR